MANLTIRNLDESVKQGLRVQAAIHGCSMEEEARKILRQAIINNAKEKGFGSFLQHIFTEAGGVDLTKPARTTPRHIIFTDNET